jgi:hypothetical protein
MTMAQYGGKVVSPTHRPHIPLRKFSWYSFLLRGRVDPRAIVRSEGFMAMKNSKTYRQGRPQYIQHNDYSHINMGNSPNQQQINPQVTEFEPDNRNGRVDSNQIFYRRSASNLQSQQN